MSNSFTTVDSSTGAASYNSLGMAAGTANIAESLRHRIRESQSTIHPGVAEVSEPDVTLIKGQLLLKLLDIENSRCNAKTDEDDRTDSLAHVLEGADHIVSRIHSGMAKYMALLGIEEEVRPAMSIAEMQERSVLGIPGELPQLVNVRVTPSQEILLRNMGRALGNIGMPLDRAELMHVDLHRGGPSSPEDQVTMILRIRR